MVGFLLFVDFPVFQFSLSFHFSTYPSVFVAASGCSCCFVFLLVFSFLLLFSSLLVFPVLFALVSCCSCFLLQCSVSSCC